MVRKLIFLVGAAVAQGPFNRLGERLGLRADTPVPKVVEDVIAAAREIITPSSEPGSEAPKPVGGAQDPNGCALGGGYRWCEAKKKCLREWEEPCQGDAVRECGNGAVLCTEALQRQGMNCAPGECVKTPETIPVCTTDEVMCTEAMQKQGMNCILGKCVKAPGSITAMAGRTDSHGCILGSGVNWCPAKNACLPKADCAGPACPNGVCTAQMQKQGFNCVLGECVAAPTALSALSTRGGGRDANGCVLGGGYTWCAIKSKCLRTWEEPCESPESAPVPVMGRERDENGCVLGGGYTWCEGKKKCLRTWEEPCEEAPPAVEAVGASQDEHGCVLGGGFTWCEGKKKCLRQWEEACEETVIAPAATGGSKDEHGCVLGGGYQWCETKKKCLRQWEEPCEPTSDRTPHSWIRNIVSSLPADKRAKVDQIMTELKQKQAEYKSIMDQKLGEIKNKDAFMRVREWAMGRRAQRQQPKIGAHEDHRVSAGEEKVDAVADGVI